MKHTSDLDQDGGHKKMAAVWYEWINKAISDGKLKAPGEFTASKPNCDKFAGTGTDAGGMTQRGSGYDDGSYSHDSEAMGVSNFCSETPHSTVVCTTNY